MGFLSDLGKAGGFGLAGLGLSKLGEQKETTINPLDAFTSGQKKSLSSLESLANTGSGAGINLGEAFTGPLGAFEQTGGELEALSGLRGLISGGDITKARDTFTNLADTRFDPSDPSSGFAEFSRALARSGKASEDVLNRESAITGSRFGTGIQGRKVDLAERLQDIRGSKLAELFQSSRQQQLAGAQGLQGIAGQQAGLFQQLANQSAVERLLKDQEAKAGLNEFSRQRGETLGRIGLLKDNIQTPLGSYTVKQPSLLSKLAPTIGQAAGTAAGAYFGGPAGAAAGGSVGKGFGSLFGGGNVEGTGVGGTRLFGKSQSDILGFNTQQFRSA